MRTLKRIFAVVLGVSACVGYCQSPSASRESGDIAVVVNSANPATQISVPELRDFLLGDRRFWAGNVQVRLVLRERGARERDLVLASILDMDNRAFAKHWRAKVFRGEAAEEPLTVTSKEVVIQYLSSTPGAMAFMAVQDVPRQLKVLRVDGKLPGEQGYAFR